MLGLVILEIAVGLSLHHFAVPAQLQPLHLLLATLLLAAELLTLMTVYMGKEVQVNENNPVNTG